MNHHLSEGEFTHDYNIITDPHSFGEDVVTRLVRSSNKAWTSSARNEEAARITDTGDGLIVHFKDRGEPIVLDYDIAEELFVLLSQQEFAPFEIKEFKTVMKWPLSQ